MYQRGAHAYEATGILTTDPCTLILMLYDGALKNLFQAREAILCRDKQGRGEHLGKVIAIVSELLSAVQGEDDTAQFLRGLYSSILEELPKVNLSNDVKTVELAIKYVAQLRNIWKEHGMTPGAKADCAPDVQVPKNGHQPMPARYPAADRPSRGVPAQSMSFRT